MSGAGGPQDGPRTAQVARVQPGTKDSPLPVTCRCRLGINTRKTMEATCAHLVAQDGLRTASSWLWQKSWDTPREGCENRSWREGQCGGRLANASCHLVFQDVDFLSPEPPAAKPALSRFETWWGPRLQHAQQEGAFYDGSAVHFSSG